MKVYRLHKEQKLPISMEEAWSYFSTPVNLLEMTPPDMDFKILSEGDLGKMYPGQIINYIVTPIAGIGMRWTTEITHVKEGAYFVDEQRFGPYAFWHHKHFFEPIPGGVLAVDTVDYALPMGFLGRIANSLFVSQRLEQIFQFRRDKLLEKYGPFDQPSASKP